jgi:hypothetical protein
MKFINPKNLNTKNVNWLVSERVRAFVKSYAEYTGHTESEVVTTSVPEPCRKGIENPCPKTWNR